MNKSEILQELRGIREDLLSDANLIWNAQARLAIVSDTLHQKAVELNMTFDRLVKLEQKLSEEVKNA